MKLHLMMASQNTAVNLAELRDYLKVCHNEEDALLVSYIRAATETCEGFLGRKLMAQQWQLTLNEWEGNYIQIPLTPLLSVDQVEVWTTDQFQDVVPENYILDQSCYLPRLVRAKEVSWPDPTREVEGIKITVTAGFGTSQNDVPHDIRLGLLHWIASVYDGGHSGEATLLHLAERLWQPYRRVRL